MKNQIINTIVVAIMIFLAIPTTAILASNNAIPGDAMYPVKTTLEKIASVLSSPSYKTHSDLEIQLIQRRIAENQKLLVANGSTEGLKLLISQAEAAAEYITGSNVKTEVKNQTIRKLIDTLEETQQILEQEKQNIAVVQQNSNSTTPNPTISQGNSPPLESASTQTNAQTNNESTSTQNSNTKTNQEQTTTQETTQDQTQETKQEESNKKNKSNKNNNNANTNNTNSQQNTKTEDVGEALDDALEDIEVLIEETQGACKPQCSQVYVPPTTQSNPNTTVTDQPEVKVEVVYVDYSETTDSTTNTMTEKEKRLEDFLLDEPAPETNYNTQYADEPDTGTGAM